jgi:hypothetical protein
MNPNCLVRPILATVLLSTAARYAAAEVVFDSTVGIVDGAPAGGTGLGTAAVGQTITLGGTLREITDFKVWLGAGGPSTFLVEFYKLDGPNNVPGTLIWQSPTQTYPYSPSLYNRKVVDVPVPRIFVPDTFAWTVSAVVGNNMIVNARAPVVTVGSQQESWFHFPDGWRASDWQFAVKLQAVPEPSGPMLFGIALAFAIVLPRMKKPARSGGRNHPYDVLECGGN